MSTGSHYRISQCSCINSAKSTTLCLFSMTFPWPLLFSMTFQARTMVFLNFRTFHDFPGPVVTLTTAIVISHYMYWPLQQRSGFRRPGTLKKQNRRVLFGKPMQKCMQNWSNFSGFFGWVVRTQKKPSGFFGYTHLKNPPPKNPHFYFNLILVYTLYATNNAIFYCF